MVSTHTAEKQKLIPVHPGVRERTQGNKIFDFVILAQELASTDAVSLTTSHETNNYMFV